MANRNHTGMLHVEPCTHLRVPKRQRIGLTSEGPKIEERNYTKHKGAEVERLWTQNTTTIMQ